MPALKLMLLIACFVFNASFTYAKNTNGACCSLMGGVSYCDSSAGRLVCNNGFYSNCYCTPHAVMDLQLLRGCCLWKGGVYTGGSLNSHAGEIVCNDGSISEECSLQNPPKKWLLGSKSY